MPHVARVEGHSFLPRYLNRESVVLDLGMNHGDFARGVIQRWGCRVIGLEPVPSLFDALATSAGFTVEQRALTARDDAQVLLHINVDEDKAASVLDTFAAADADAVKVPGVTLGRFMNDHGVERADLVKMDVEGAEVDALEGAPDDVLLRVRQLTVEFHDFVDPRLKPRIASIHSRMEKLGFRRLTFSVSDYDVLYVHPAIQLRELDVRFIVAQKYWNGARRRLLTRLHPTTDKDRL